MEQQKQQVATDNKTTPGNQAQPKTDVQKTDAQKAEDAKNLGNVKQTPPSGGIPTHLAKEPNASTTANAPKTS